MLFAERFSRLEEATKWPSRRMGRSSPAPPVLPDFFADQAGHARLLLGHRDDPALGRPACDLEQQLGPDRFLELFAILDRHDERARAPDDAVLVIEVEIVDIHRRVGWLL